MAAPPGYPARYQPAAASRLTTLWRVIICLTPLLPFGGYVTLIVGLSLWYVWKPEEPGRARDVLIFSFIAAGITLLLTPLVVIFLGGAVIAVLAA